MDVIRLRGIQAYCHVGHTLAERELGHAIEVDLEMVADLSRAGRSDRLSDTIDYAEAYRRVVAVCEKGAYALLETVAESVADAILAMGVQRVVVRVRKPNPPFGGVAAASEVEIDRVHSAPESAGGP